MDGFPRTLKQAESLDARLAQTHRPSLNLVVHLNVPRNIILERITHRWTHIPSGRVYHTFYNPPKIPGKDDVTGEALSQRPDDTPDVFKTRLEKYEELTRPLLDYYTRRNLLTSIAGDTSDLIYAQLTELLKVRL